MKTYSDGPPVTQLTDGVGQDERRKPENSQELREERKRTEGGIEGESDRKEGVEENNSKEWTKLNNQTE